MQVACDFLLHPPSNINFKSLILMGIISRTYIELTTHSQFFYFLKSFLSCAVRCVCESMISSANYFINGSIVMKPIPVTVLSKVWVCGSSLAGIAGSNLAGGMDVCVWQMLCACREV